MDSRVILTAKDQKVDLVLVHKLDHTVNESPDDDMGPKFDVCLFRAPLYRSDDVSGALVGGSLLPDDLTNGDGKARKFFDEDHVQFRIESACEQE